MRVWVWIATCVLLIGVIGLVVWAYTPDKPRAEIEAKYKVGAGDYLDVVGLRIRLRDSGPKSAPAVILLHGFGSSLETWDAWSAALSGEFRVIRVDLPGFGLTGLDPTGDYTDARGLAVLAATMEKLGIARASFVGNSLGGKLAWMFATKNPTRVAKLVLISPDGFASTGFEYGKAPNIPLSVRLLPWVLPRALVRASLKPAYGSAAAMTDATVERYRDFMLAPGIRWAMIRRMEQTVLERPEPMLRRVQAPTLLLWGEKDGMIPIGNSANYVRLIPNAKLVALPGLGHVPQEEAPERALEPVRDFLR